MSFVIEKRRQRIIILFIVTIGALFILCSAAGALTLSPNSPPLSAPSIAKGDTVYIHGIATGHPQNGLQVWLIGYNYVKIASVSVNADNTYEYELKPADTSNLASGQYFVLAQHPMMVT